MIDGWLVRSSLSGLQIFWLVKGYHHTEDYVVVVPYRVDRHSKLVGSMSILKDYLTWKILDCIGWPVPVISRNNIDLVVNPFTALQLRLSDLPSEIVELIDYLGSEVGLTGSWALGFESPVSDVDLIIYGNPSHVISVLKELRHYGRIRQCRPTKLIASKVGSEEWMLDHYKARLLESCYRGVPYTIRILRSLNEAPCTERAYPLGVADNVIVEFKNCDESHLVPAVYKARVISQGYRAKRIIIQNEVTIETWRTRYQELPCGIYELLHPRVTLKNNEVILSVDPGGSLRPISWSDNNKH